MTSRRLKLRDNKGELREEFEYSSVDDIGEWIADRIPDPPPGQLCESEDCVQLMDYDPSNESDGEIKRPLAVSYFYKVKGDHVCYTFVCYDCSESAVEYLEPVDAGDYPTTDSGYAISPQHCA